MKPEAMEVRGFGNDRTALIEAVSEVLERLRTATADICHSRPIHHLTFERRGADGKVTSWSEPLYLRDLFAVGAMTQTPLIMWGATARGKTALADMALAGLYGPHGKGYRKVEVSRGMTVDDLVDIDVKRLTESKLSEAVSAAKWLSFPAQLLDEINRAPAKLTSALLHIVDASGINVRGDLSLDVGMPYKAGQAPKRYSFTVATANVANEAYDGCYEMDAALLRRLAITINLDELPAMNMDISRILSSRRAKRAAEEHASRLELILQMYESLTESISYSALAHLFLHYLSGMNNCVRTSHGRIIPAIKSLLCEKCHLAKATPFCGRIGGLGEGHLLVMKEVSGAISAIRAAKILAAVSKECEDKGAADIQGHLGSKARGEKLFHEFRETFLADLQVLGEDVVAAYTLLAPEHVWFDERWFQGEAHYEQSQRQLFADAASRSWMRFQNILETHRELFADLVTNGEIPAARQAEAETLVTTEDAAMLSVISALREQEFALRSREALVSRSAA